MFEAPVEELKDRWDIQICYGDRQTTFRVDSAQIAAAIFDDLTNNNARGFVNIDYPEYNLCMAVNIKKVVWVDIRKIKI